MSSGDTVVKRTADVVDDELKDLRQRASLLHHRQMLIYTPSAEREQKVRELEAEVLGSTWNALRQLKADNVSLKSQSAALSASKHASALSPRGKSPRARAEFSSEFQVEEALQRQVAQLTAENERLRSKVAEAAL